jgi:pimeloyl-ACP methyl ester carboxylesterase
MPVRTSPRWLLRVAASVCLLAAMPRHGAGLRPEKPPGRTSADPAPEVLHAPKATIEVGTLAGVPYRIDVPSDWNHSLVIFFHGYSETPVLFTAAPKYNEVTGPVIERGFAIAQSGYSLPGWALAEGVPESEALRQYFIKTYGKVKETYAVGVSMGGAMVMVTMEQNPKPYTAALDLCGAVGPTYEAFQRRFAWRAAFDFYFPGIMPPMVPAPVEYHETAALKEKIAAALKANPVAATAMRNLTGLHTDADLVSDVSYFTFVITDIQHRSGGNPFDNRNTIYVGTAPGTTTTDEALNDGVKRYAADEPARRYLVEHYTPSGKVSKPMLAVHTTYDPLIPGWTLARYADQIAEAGYSENFVQQYVHREGHCAISPKQIGSSFDELLLWVHAGRRPVPGLLRP